MSFFAHSYRQEYHAHQVMGSCPGIFVLQTKVLGGAGLCKGLSPSRPPGAGEEREGEKMRDPGNEVGSVRLFTTKIRQG